MTPNYLEIVERLESGAFRPFLDSEHVMALLGYETKQHGRLGVACRPIGERHWQSLPRFDSADCFELWVIRKTGGQINDIGRNENGDWYVSYDDPVKGNDYGYSARLGRAMWAAFVALYGGVDRT